MARPTPPTGKSFPYLILLKNNLYIYRKSLKFTFDTPRGGGGGGGDVRKVTLTNEGKDDYEETTRKLGWGGGGVQGKKQVAD